MHEINDKLYVLDTFTVRVDISHNLSIRQRNAYFTAPKELAKAIAPYSGCDLSFLMLLGDFPEAVRINNRVFLRQGQDPTLVWEAGSEDPVKEPRILAEVSAPS